MLLMRAVFEDLVFIEDSVRRGAAIQMALDQALLELTQVPVLRVYQWESPCVTVGYFESHASAASEHPGIPVVRRWTGGGKVLHGRDAPYSLIVPQREPFATVRPADAYRVLHGALAEALQGRLPNIALAAERAPKRGVACFDNPVSDDLLCDGQKVGGAGQRRTRQGLLHQGSLQLKGARFEEAPRFAQLLAVRVQTAELSPEILLLAEHLAKTRYGLLAWNEDRRRASP
jgi:lipoate-protein ligase A